MKLMKKMRHGKHYIINFDIINFDIINFDIINFEINNNQLQFF